MSSPNHHPTEAVLADYAAGALRPAFSIVVAAHLESCPHCRVTLRGLEALGGEMVANLEESAMSDEALDRVMAGIERPLDAAPAKPAPSTVDRIGFGRELWLGPGMGIRKAKIEGGDLLYLLRLPAGLQTIPHSHQGTEFTTVLKGAFDDGTGVFAAGDFADVNGEIDHQPHVTPDSECICLIASEKPMLVRTMIGRIVHMMTGV
jgi:putative transcriptional regulator